MDILEETILTNLLYNEEYARRSCVHLRDDYFQIDTNKAIFRLFWNYFGERGKIPSKDELVVELECAKNLRQDTFKDASEFLSDLKAPNKTPDLKWLLEKTEEFCRQRAFYNVLVEAAEKVESGPNMLGDIPERCRDALGITFDTRIGHDYLVDVDERYHNLYENNETKIPFDLKMFNKVFGGGLSPKTLNIIAAGTGAGKTMFLCHFAQHLFKSGYKVLYITLEMAEERISERIDANIMDTPLADLPLLTKEQYKARFEKGCGKKAGKLIIKEYPTCGANVGNFRALLNDLKLKKAFEPDVLIVDYINITATQRNIPASNSYQYVKAVCEELRALAIEYNVPVLSSTQFNRGGTDSSDVGLGDISESHGLSMTADTLFGLVRTESLDEENLVQVKQLKNRFSDISTNRKFLVGVDRSKMRVFDIAEDKVKIGGSKEHHEEKKIPSKQEFNIGKTRRVVNASGIKF